MLPSLRFLFVAVLLSLSMMIFGLGAASLLRSAHQEVASLPTRHVQPDTVFAHEPEASMPTLAMLSVDAPAPEHHRSDRPAEPDAPVPAQSSPVAAQDPAPTSTAGDKPAAQSGTLSEQESKSMDKPSETPALRAADIEVPSPPERHDPENPKQEPPRQGTQAAVDPEPANSASAPATGPGAESVAEAPAVSATEPIAAVAATTTGAAPELTTAAPEVTAALPEAPITAAKTPTEPTDEGGKAAMAKLATLGTLTAPAEPQTPSKAAVARMAKREQARQLAKRRRIARARMLQRPADRPATAQPSQPVPAQFFLVARPGG